MIIIENYINKPGEHCISTSIRDIFDYNGYVFTEDFILGLDSCIGFNLIKEEYRRKDIYFLGGKRDTFDLSIYEECGIKIIESNSLNTDDFSEIVKSINKNIPVMVQVDMYYLSYFQKRPDHFGGHMIVLVGYDLNRQIFYVSERKDTRLIDKKNNQFYELKFEDFKHSINSTECSMFPPEGKSYMFKFDSELDIKKLIKVSIRKAASEYLYKVSKYQGIEGLYNFPIILEEFIKTLFQEESDLYLINNIIKKQLFSISLSIESIGTGGGLFRKMYGNFLDECYHYYSDIELIKAKQLILTSSYKFTELSKYIMASLPKLQIDCELNYILEIIDNIKNILKECYICELEAFSLLNNWSLN